MATKNSIAVDVENKRLVINWMSSHKTITKDDNNNNISFKFTKIYVDTTKTFNCKNSPSTTAEAVPINITIGINEDLDNYYIPFSNILTAPDDELQDELFFVWLEEIICDNNGDPDYPHTINSETVDKPTLNFGVTLSVKRFYNLLLETINITDNSCEVGCADVNTMLAWDGFNLAKILGEYKQMIYYWNILHTAKNRTFSSCNCNK